MLPVSRPVALPPVLTETSRIDGSRQLAWVCRDLKPGETVELQQTVLQLEYRCQPAAEGKTLELVARLLNNWKNERTDQEKDWQFDDWAESLEEFSEAHLRAACKTWREEQPFPPKIADIRGLCLSARYQDEEMRRRCRVLLGLQDPYQRERPKPVHEPVPITDEQRAKVESIIGKLGD